MCSCEKIYSCEIHVLEINRVRASLLHWNVSKETASLPEPYGQVVTLSEKLFVPVSQHPDVCITRFATATETIMSVKCALLIFWL